MPKILFSLLALCTLFPPVSGGPALLIGLLAALFLGNPFQEYTKKLTKPLLSLAVIGLGAGIDLVSVGRAGLHGFAYTVAGIAFTFALGLWLAKLLKIEQNIALLVTVGTAICGGSAIAAMSPVIRAKHHEVSVAMAVVFVLNAAALFLFPAIGAYLAMGHAQFGLWSALAIHDTSSVVGASLQYGGAETVAVATTVKLARALWIVPVTLLVGHFVKRTAGHEKVNSPFPWFIIGFILLSALSTFLPEQHGLFSYVEFAARRLLIVTLFFIGANLSKEDLRQVGVTPLAMGIVLWIVVASVSLAGILLTTG